MSAVEERISDRRLLSLLRAFLRAGVMEQGTVRRPVTGTAQGGVISPLMCNVYLHRLDRAWRGAYGTYLRYADDALVMCRSKGQAVAALARLTVLLAELGLRPKPAKTRIVQLSAGGEGVDFLGFHHRLVRSRAVPGRAGVTFLARWPSRKAMQHARNRIRLHDDAGPAGCSGRTGRAGDQPVPARLGGLFPLRELRPRLRSDQTLRGDAARGVHRETPPARARLGIRPNLLLGRRSGSDQPQRHRHRTQAPPGLAGEI